MTRLAARRYIRLFAYWLILAVLAQTIFTAIVTFHLPESKGNPNHRQ